MVGLSSSRIASVCLFLLVAYFAPFGSLSAATLVLKDGAVIHGEIKSLKDDEYTVKSDSLGTVRVRKQSVRTIDHSGSATLQSAPSPRARSDYGSTLPEQAELQAMQSRMMQDPLLFSMIQALQGDPEVQAVLADPEILSAIAAGNYDVLLNHPKIIALTRNASVRRIIDETQ